MADRAVQKRTFYPAALQPTASEISAHARHKRRWFPRHKEIWRRTRDYKVAQRYLSKPTYFSGALQLAVGFLVLVLGSWFLWPDLISKAMRSGFVTASGTVLKPVPSFGVVFLSIQGCVSILGFMVLNERKKRNYSQLVKDRYEEWIRRKEVKQEDLQHVLLPHYDKPCPYDPTDPDINIVLGEYFDNDAHKFGPVAHWYTLKMKGMKTGGTVIFGVTGSGKTSSVLRPVMRQSLGWMAHVDFDPENRGREKVAGFILDPKGSLAYDAKAVLETAGTDPVLDPHQISKNGPANITGLYYLMHEQKGALGEGGKMLFEPEFIKKYRGRSDDYLELGYDEAKVDKVWKKFQEFQDAASGLSKKLVDATADAPIPRNQLTIALPSSSQGASSGLIDLLEAKGDAKSYPTRQVLANLKIEIDAIQWARHLDKFTAAMVEPLGIAMDDLVRWLWVGRKADGPTDDKSGQSVVVHPMIPGTPFSMLNSLEAYAVNRNQIRRYAPAKQRPIGGIDDYKDAWAMREVRMWAFRDKQVGVARRAEASARMYALMQRFLKNDPNLKNQEKAEAYGTQLGRDINLLTRPLNELLGEHAVAWDWGRPAVVVHEDLKTTTERIRGSLEPWMVEAFRKGDYQSLSVPISEVPKPEEVSDEKRKELKGRYVEPDPVVVLARRASEMRQAEHRLLGQLLAEARDGLSGATKEVNDQAEVWAKILEDKLARVAIPKDGGRVREFILGALDAIRVNQGGENNLAADLVATILGMPTLPTPQTRNLMKGLYKAVGDKGEEFGVQAAFGAANVPGAQLHHYLHEATDAVADAWLKKPLGGVLVVGHSFLQSLGYEESQRDVLMTELRAALKALADNWVHAHLAALELVLENPTWAERLGEIGRKGLELFREADRYSRMGALVGYVEDSLVTDPRERKKASPNADWGDLIWSWETINKKARVAPFWRGPMTGLDMTPLHATQWDPAWSAIVWRLLGYSLNAAPQSLTPLAKLARRCTELGMYHQASLEAFQASVAPNIAWRTDGPYAYNPLYADDLAPIVVAGTFNQTVFAATSEGKDSSDAFWENASFTVVFNLLQTLLLVDGYATFPKIDALVTNEAILREYMDILRERVAKRDGSPEDIEVMTNILRWADGEWLTEASAKSETKDNIIRSLSVVTQPFKEPRFAICFAPAAKEDCSFPSWTWCMREGKVVVGNLPWEKYEKVAKVVLPLANKTFQKAVMMRDGVRPVNERIVKENRKEIEVSWRYINELMEGLKGNAAERLVLSIYLGRSLNEERKHASRNRDSEHELRELVGGDHYLVLWRKSLKDHTGLRNPTRCFGDVFLRQSRMGLDSADMMLGFLAGASGKAKPFSGEYLLASRQVQAGIEAGFFIHLLAMTREGTSSLGARAGDGNRTAEALLSIFTQAINLKEAGAIRDLLGYRNAEAVATDAKALPGLLVDEMADVLSRTAIVRLTSRLDQLIHDERMSGSAENYDGGAADAMRPRIRLQKAYLAMRALEAQIAQMPNTERAVLYLTDEAHFFVNGREDAQFVSVARSANALNFYSTQSPNSLIAKMGDEVTKQFLDSLPNRVILRMPDSKTAEACAEYMGGKTYRQVYEKSISQSFDDVRMDRTSGAGRGKSEGGSVSVQVKEEERWVVDLHQIVNLQAMECFAMVWDGKKNAEVRRVYTKPDYLYVTPAVRNFKRSGDKRYADLPKDIKDGEDLYALTVPRLLEYGVIDASR